MRASIAVLCAMVLLSLLAVLPRTATAAGAQYPQGQSDQSNMGGMNTARSSMAAGKEFIQEATKGGEAEVELGRLATKNASSPEVKQFGQRMVDDHSQANEKLKEVVRSEGITISSGLSAKDRSTLNELSKLNGTQFDQAYMTHMVKDHQKDVAAFEKESKDGTDPQIKQFAAHTLPTLQDHLREAEKISSQSGSSMEGTTR